MEIWGLLWRFGSCYRVLGDAVEDSAEVYIVLWKYVHVLPNFHIPMLQNLSLYFTWKTLSQLVLSKKCSPSSGPSQT